VSILSIAKRLSAALIVIRRDRGGLGFFKF
jgi:hypothetical protein